MIKNDVEDVPYCVPKLAYLPYLSMVLTFKCTAFVVWRRHWLTIRHFHRLHESASLVLRRYIIPMGGSVTFCFFSQDPCGSDPSTDRHAKWLKRRGFGQGCVFWSKNRNCWYHLTPAPKTTNIWPILVWT